MIFAAAARARAISTGFDGPSAESQIEFAIRVLDEDHAMCGNQSPRGVPVNPVTPWPIRFKKLFAAGSPPGFFLVNSPAKKASFDFVPGVFTSIRRR